MLCNLVDASSASLYVCPSTCGVREPLLIHEGETLPVAELADKDAAAAFCARNEDADRLVAETDARPLFQLITSSSEGGMLIHLDPSPSILQAGLVNDEPLPKRRATDSGESARRARPGIWFGLRMKTGERLRLPLTLNDLAAMPEPDRWWDLLLSLNTAITLHMQQVSAMIDDPVSTLPGRLQFEIRLTQAVDQAAAFGRPFTLLLVNPDSFEVVNEHFGRDAGDSVIREIAERLTSLIRDTDLVHRYGSAIFAVVVPGAGLDDGIKVAEKLRSDLTEGAYLRGTVRLGFNIGLTEYTPAPFENAREVGLDLFRQADRALCRAKESGGGQIVTWGPEAGLGEVGNLDRLSGIFTADLAKDYRNMLLLWDTVEIISESPDPENLAAQAVERLQEAFKPERAALFLADDAGDLYPAVVRNRLAVSESERGILTLSEDQRQLLDEAMKTDEPVKRSKADEEQGEPAAGWAVPLASNGRCLGCLYLDGGQIVTTLDSSDLLFLKALSDQLAAALDHARLAALDRTRQDEKRSLLQVELNDLRRALGQARLVSRSPEMESVLSTVRRVAPTNATVLITGESGTGKELVARTIHEMSDRKNRPFMVVDCGAIAATLIDSELFGREKGAYTGAQERARGRLAEADGGTVVLDEIGELPIEVQSKLLRFVQERQITPVGGTRAAGVDVRLIAVTNRDLHREVKAGRFREDLYHRLNVVTIVTPALRERPDDILLLAEHFLNMYSVQYQKGIRRFGREIEAEMLAYRWPGNVRELQNRIMKAVILSEGGEIGFGTLGISGPAGAPEPPGMTPSALSETSEPGLSRPVYNSSEAEPAWSEDDSDVAVPAMAAWAALTDALDQQVEAAGRNGRNGVLPLGRWLDQDLVLEACQAAGGILRQGAEILGIPETTFRRKATRALADDEAGLLPRSPGWSALRPLIAAWLRSDHMEGESRLDMVRLELLSKVADRNGDRPSLAAALMGVTPATYRSWLQKLTSNGPV